MKFNSQIHTTREQSERLLALGLKKETADCNYPLSMIDWKPCQDCPRIGNPLEQKYNAFPAWSLHRLIEMVPVDVSCDNVSEYFTIGKDFFVGQYVTYGQLFWKEGTSIYDNIIDCIEWLIKEGYFNKEYLCEN